ncbi:Putative GroES-like superfamily, alcohol dehydrogenase-like, NAD(P)-binding domain superfamily [Septoria linicola]|uniref:GroES-like superfamily, alcohol dehydrogenase-like, NAD(P)-binding domain superfamily n=1 Tax=Septoria linicola TaxID=215465 RepID=A0A9Q9AYX0_9PEZI|nr:putative GroES-like superfamily, alcohol dehydrogenase-like, NAD(P)-binding domain superfamily [Septoria linicola]USW57665.1 Putative GroES-like superfamily, alcohol dehydrogenase-like, NAD(P)-binding domain superfamily [Septoria linicola]
MGEENIPKKMKAVQVVEYKKPYEIREVDVPSDLQENDLLVKVAVASNCHTDSMVQQGVFGTPLPQTASHEGGGTVVKVGPKAAEKGFKVGDRVMVGIPLHPCGACGDCLGPENQQQYCMQLEGHVGVQTNGCFADYIRADARSTTVLPDEVSFMSAAPLACAGRTVFRAVIKSRLVSGQWLCFVGSGGGLGHLGVQFAKALGLKVIGVDARDEGLELTKHYGADIVIDARKGKDAVVKEVQAVTGGQGADASITLSDHKDAAAIACASTKMHGTMVQIAQPDTIEIPFPEIIFRDIRIIGSLISSAEESKQMLSVIAEHGVTCTTEKFYGLDSIFDLVELVHGGKIKGKAIIIVDNEQIEHENKIGAKF